MAAETIQTPIYVAVCKPTSGDEPITYMSLDDEKYLPVVGDFEDIDPAELRSQIEQLFEGNGKFRPMSYAKRAMSAHWMPFDCEFEYRTIPDDFALPTEGGV